MQVYTHFAMEYGGKKDEYQYKVSSLDIWSSLQ